MLTSWNKLLDMYRQTLPLKSLPQCYLSFSFLTVLFKIVNYLFYLLLDFLFSCSFFIHSLNTHWVSALSIVKGRAGLYRSLTCARHHYKHFTWINSFIPHDNSRREELLWSSPVYRCGKWGREDKQLAQVHRAQEWPRAGEAGPRDLSGLLPEQLIYHQR